MSIMHLRSNISKMNTDYPMSSNDRAPSLSIPAVPSVGSFLFPISAYPFPHFFSNFWNILSKKATTSSPFSILLIQFYFVHNI